MTGTGTGPAVGPPADLATVVARFGAALHAAGLPVGQDRCERFARAILLARPRTTSALYWCGVATLVSDPAQQELFDPVFATVFGGLVDPADARGDPNAPALPEGSAPAGWTPPVDGAGGYGAPDAGSVRDGPARGSRPATEVPVRALAAAAEQLSGRDFAALSPDELLRLTELMRRFTLATPVRRTRRSRSGPQGRQVDLRATLRQSRRTGGYPVRLRRRSPRYRPRRLVVLCDISGSMEPYARAMVQLLYCAAGGSRAEVFTFATRLTRLTRLLYRVRPDAALERAGRAAPDWAGGTRIGAAVREFNDRYGARGLARGAVVLVVSDGWDTGDPALLGREMARLSRVAYRIVWANPRTQSPRYQPLAGGMAAAWPYCDAVVSAHRLTALDDLTAALRDPARGRR